jgi:DNA-binding winged helix-turn-helix (wHTH) protein
MRLLVCLAEHAGEVVSIDDLLTQVWPDVTVSPDSVYQAVTSLRRALGDDTKQPAYIATVPRLGYRLIAPVIYGGPIPGSLAELPPEALSDEAPAPTAGPAPAAESPVASLKARRRYSWPDLALAATALVCIMLVVTMLPFRKSGQTSQTAASAAASQSQTPIAVIPFLDLTDGMKNGEFADGLTEELIDKLSLGHFVLLLQGKTGGRC